jgi:hypothetical protein
MRAKFLLGAAGFGGVMLVLVAMCVAWAQSPRSRPSGLVPAIQSEPASVPSTSIVPATAATFQDAPGTGFPGGLYGGPPPQPASAKPAIIELRNGLKLEGRLADGVLPCRLAFGDVPLPLETIRGIRLSDEMTAIEGGTAQPASATIVLENGDSLTGLPRVEVLQLHTEWGQASVKLSHLKLLILTDESVTWTEHEGRWRLSPMPTSQVDSLPPADAADSNPVLERSSGDLDLPPSLVPPQAPTPPPPTRSAPPALPRTSDDGQ